MSQSSHDQPHNGKPTPAEIFRVFRKTTTASISGLKLLLEECADLRGDLITIHGRTEIENGDGDGLFSARQQSRIAELKNAAQAMEALLIALPREANTVEDGGDEN